MRFFSDTTRVRFAAVVLGLSWMLVSCDTPKSRDKELGEFIAEYMMERATFTTVEQENSRQRKAENYVVGKYGVKALETFNDVFRKRFLRNYITDDQIVTINQDGLVTSTISIKYNSAK